MYHIGVGVGDEDEVLEDGANLEGEPLEADVGHHRRGPHVEILALAAPWGGGREEGDQKK